VLLFVVVVVVMQRVNYILCEQSQQVTRTHKELPSSRCGQVSGGKLLLLLLPQEFYAARL